MDTLLTETDAQTPRAQRQPDTTVLVVVWSREEPEHLGEVLQPEIEPGYRRAVIFGRGDESPGRGLDRVGLLRQRPGSNEAAAPLESRKLSRDQLKIQSCNDGQLEIENLGRRELFVNGRKLEQARVGPGDVLEVRGAMMLFVTRRPRVLPGTQLPPALWPSFATGDRAGMLGESAPMWQLRAQIAFVAQHDVHTLVLGPSGTGKELVARAIHLLSKRSARPLVSRNAATFPATLIDAELFGNIADYPNVGTPARPGLIGAAHESCLFLDEIGELPHELQAHLLRVLDRGEYQRLGEAQPRRANLRLLAATNRSLDALKHDFVARARMHIEVPGLETRREDIGLLIPALIRAAAGEDAQALGAFFPDRDPDKHPRVDASLVRAALQHPFTTHVRELESMLWTAMMHSATTGLDHVGPLASTSVDPRPTGEVDPASLSRERIVEVLARVGGVKDHAWPQLGLRNRFQLNRLIKKYDIDLDVLGKSLD